MHDAPPMGGCTTPLLVDDVVAALADAHLGAILLEAVAHARRLGAVWAHQHHVRDVQRHLHVNNAGLPDSRPVLDVLGRHVDPRHHHAVLLADDAVDLATLPAVLARDDHHVVVTSNVGHGLQDLRRLAHNLHKALLAQLARDRAKDARAARVVLRVDQDHGIVVKADVGSVGAAIFLGRAHDHGAHDLTLLHRAARLGLLDGPDDNVPHAG